MFFLLRWCWLLVGQISPCVTAGRHPRTRVPQSNKRVETACVGRVDIPGSACHLGLVLMMLNAPVWKVASCQIKTAPDRKRTNKNTLTRRFYLDMNSVLVSSQIGGGPRGAKVHTCNRIGAQAHADIFNTLEDFPGQMHTEEPSQIVHKHFSFIFGELQRFQSGFVDEVLKWTHFLLSFLAFPHMLPHQSAAHFPPSKRLKRLD